MKEQGKSPAFVIAADKDLGKVEFLATLKSFRKITAQKRVWIQVWGVHPYPLQLPLDVGEADDMEAKFKECRKLQEIVDYLIKPGKKNLKARK